MYAGLYFKGVDLVPPHLIRVNGSPDYLDEIIAAKK